MSIPHVQQLEGMLKALMRATVADERAKGRTWAQIGEQLGVTRATAHGRFAGITGHPSSAKAAWEAIAALAASQLDEETPKAPPGFEPRLNTVEALLAAVMDEQGYDWERSFEEMRPIRISPPKDDS
jgi:dsRNA-specific ribonuclease